MDEMKDVICKIFTYCDILTFHSVRLSCKKNYYAICDNELIWSDLVDKNFEEKIIKANESFGKISYKQLFRELLIQKKKQWKLLPEQLTN